MKRNLLRLILSCALLLFAFSAARGETARDVTQECSFAFSYAASSASLLRDRNHHTVYECDAQTAPRLKITVGDTPVSSIYMEFGRAQLPFEVQVKQDGAWCTVACCEGLYKQSYVSFPPVTGEMRLCFDGGGRSVRVGVSEIYCYSAGDPPDTVHIWQPAPAKADLLIVTAHPDDEVLWLGGCIPYYAGERQLQVAVMCITCSHAFRELELLNCLWHLGVRQYPLVGRFQDVNTTSVEDTYKKWDRSKVNAYLIDTLRALRPEVVVTHGFGGEYGHFHHKALAYSVQRTVQLANEDNQYSALPRWQVKKVYHHGGEQPTTVMDWDQPLKAFDGKTGYEMACEGYLFHQSQARTWYSVAKRGERWDSYVYSLTYSAVGEDRAGGDLFENVPVECLSSYNK